jgi:hypothetical protein
LRFVRRTGIKPHVLSRQDRVRVCQLSAFSFSLSVSSVCLFSFPLSVFSIQLSAFLFLPSLRAAPPAFAGHAVRLARPAVAPHSDGGKPPTRCFRMLTPLRSFHPSATVTGCALRIRIRENSTGVFRLRTFGPGLRPNTGGCPWHASGRRNTALAHALIARRANHPASFPLPNSHGRKRPKSARGD